MGKCLAPPLGQHRVFFASMLACPACRFAFVHVDALRCWSLCPGADCASISKEPEGFPDVGQFAGSSVDVAPRLPNFVGRSVGRWVGGRGLRLAGLGGLFGFVFLVGLALSCFVSVVGWVGLA